MQFVIHDSKEEGRFVLTDEREDGFWMLRVSGAPKIHDGVFSPSDFIDSRQEPTSYAAAVVFNWAVEAERTEEEIAASREYLRRWPDGPQAEEEDIAASQSFKAALPQVARDLDAGEPCYMEMTPDQLLAAIMRMVDELAEYETNSPHAYVLRIRITTASTVLCGHATRGKRSEDS